MSIHLVALKVIGTAFKLELSRLGFRTNQLDGDVSIRASSPLIAGAHSHLVCLLRTRACRQGPCNIWMHKLTMQMQTSAGSSLPYRGSISMSLTQRPLPATLYKLLPHKASRHVA